MNIELFFEEDLKEGMVFRIPIDSEADEFLSGLVTFRVLDGDLYIRTNCMGAKNNLEYSLDIIHFAMNQVYMEETGHDINDAR